MNKIKYVSLVFALSLLLLPSLAIAQTQKQSYPLAPKDAATIKDIQGQNFNNPQAPGTPSDIKSTEDINKLLKSTENTQQNLVVTGSPATPENKADKATFPWPLIVLWLIVMITPLIAIIKLLGDLKEERNNTTSNSSNTELETKKPEVTKQANKVKTKSKKRQKKSKKRY